LGRAVYALVSPVQLFQLPTPYLESRWQQGLAIVFAPAKGEWE